MRILLLFLILISTASADKVIVVLKGDLDFGDIHELKYKVLNIQKDLIDEISQYNVKNFKQLWIVNSIAIDTTPDVIEVIKNRKDVLRIIPDYRVKINLWNVEKINANLVWKYGINGSGINVSIVDTGVNSSHPDLLGKIVAWKDLVNGLEYPYDDNGHGTHVAGIVAGDETGVAPGANLICVKVFDSDGSAELSTVIEGFQWSAENGADVISFSGGTLPYTVVGGSSVVYDVKEHTFEVYPYVNEPAFKPASISVVVQPSNIEVSLVAPNGSLVQWSECVDGSELVCRYYGDEPLTDGSWKLRVESDGEVEYSYQIYVVYPSDGTSLIDEAVNNLAKVGIVVVSAAGNEGELGFRTINSPASAKYAIAVGALDSSDNLAYFSSKGPTGWGENETIKPDVVAPGVSILSTYYKGGYAYGSGTSMATPHVSGIVALMLQANRSLTPEDVKRVLKMTSIDLGEFGEDNIYGAGCVNALYAVMNVTTFGEVYFNTSTIPLNRNVTVEVVLSSAPNGLSMYNVTVLVGDLVEIVGVYFPEWASFAFNSTLPSSEVTVYVEDGNNEVQSGAKNISLFYLVMRGVEIGETYASISINRVEGDDGEMVSLDASDCYILVRLDRFPNCDYPSDPDGDGLYEDTNGNGVKDINDLFVLFTNMDWVAENEYIPYFDFNGNGEMDVNDLLNLFNEI